MRYAALPVAGKMVAMINNETNVDDIIALLTRTPASLKALLDGLPDTWINATEGDNTWSPYDVIGHLIQGERSDWVPRLRHVLAGNMQPFVPFDRTAQFEESQGKSLAELLSRFATLRKENMAELAGMNLTRVDLDRKGQHPDFGEVTLGQLLATWAVHDLDHVCQIARTMARVCSYAVGPWTAYLSILHDRKLANVISPAQ
jgi:hypothetical protein